MASSDSPPAPSDVVLAADRLRALYDTGLPDSAHDPATQQTFDRLTRLATRLLGVPVSLVSLVDADRQVFVGCVGLDGEAGAARETPLSHSFCQQVVTTALPVVIGDARTDPRTAPGMPGALAVRDLGVTAYAGVPLVDVDGYVLGAFCAIDQVPRAWTADDVAVLSDLAASAISEIELRRVADRARAARESAVAADVAKSTFLSTMSHEIRTPLNAIAGYVEILALEIAGPLTTQQRDYLGRLGAASDHLRSLISDVLDLAKVDAGELRVTRDVGMTHEVVAAALDLVTPQGDARGVALVDDTADTCVAYVGDADRVRQILVNLLGNAVKFTPSGGRVTVTCAVVAAHPPDVEVHGEGPWARLRVEDTGIGIPLAQQAVVFEPFRQVEGDKTVGSGGTGLGLAISRRLARRMGGDLVLASAPGVGSTFTLWLPAAGGAEETAADRGARAERPVLGAS